jgi:nicotinamidase-related amidase
MTSKLAEHSANQSRELVFLKSDCDNITASDIVPERPAIVPEISGIKENQRMLTVEDSVLLIIDVQEKLLRVMLGKEILVSNLQKLIKGCSLMGVPIIFTEQNPTGLGGTTPELTDLVTEFEPVIKFNFSCCAESGFNEKLKNLGRRQVIVCGIESHICVYQTSMDLLAGGYEVHLTADCVSSRTSINKELAVRRMISEGIKLTGLEMCLFELLRTSKTQHFKAISALIKD